MLPFLFTLIEHRQKFQIKCRDGDFLLFFPHMNPWMLLKAWRCVILGDKKNTENTWQFHSSYIWPLMLSRAALHPHRTLFQAHEMRLLSVRQIAVKLIMNEVWRYVKLFYRRSTLEFCFLLWNPAWVRGCESYKQYFSFE